MALNPNQLKTLSSGAYADGGGLYLVVRDSGDRVWAFRFTALDGKRAQMEFGKLADYTLSAARDKAREYRLGLKAGTDPRAKKALDQQDATTFKEFADAQYPDWCKGCSAEEEKQWRRSIADMRLLHARKIHEITTAHVLEALKTIWFAKPITADRTRQRLERLFDAAKALKLRVGENPATWRGNLKPLLPSARKLNRQKSKGGHTSLAYEKLPALMAALRYEPGRAARCVEVGILTVSRSQEIRLMEWTEIDFQKKTWLIPATKMKIKGKEQPKPHLVPLSDQAIDIIQSMPTKNGRYVFPSDDHNAEHDTPFFPNALTATIKRCGHAVTMHGMRTSFRNWDGESVKHNFRREVLEHCLSHRLGDDSERAYWTGDAVERRRVVLQAWANYIRPNRGKNPVLELVA